MTSATDILRDAFGRMRDELPQQLKDLDAETLLWRPDADANSIAWLAWHLARVQDDHVAGVGQVEQVWTKQGFAEKFGLPYPTQAVGYGQSSTEVGAFFVTDPTLLSAYYEAVAAQTETILAAMDDAAFARIVDERWDPPVTAAVRLVSVVGDITAHVGQIGYVAGLAQRR